MRFAGERGQTAAEYLGALLIVAVVVGAVATTNVGGTIRRHASERVCKIAGGCERGATRDLHDSHPVAYAANIPCDDMSPQECSALRALINRAQAERVADVASVVNRPGIWKAVNALLRRQTNREGARLLTSVTNRALSNLIKSNYRYGARIGKGSTADAVRDEAVRGIKFTATNFRGELWSALPPKYRVPLE